MTDTAISPLRRRMMCDAVIQPLLRPTERALLLARCQGPRPLPAVLPASRPFTPSAISAARRRRGVFHCRHRAARSRVGPNA